jgi:Flp pilus assembly protein TadD
MKPLARTLFLFSLLSPAFALAAPTEMEMRSIAAANTDYQFAKQAIQKEDWKTAITALNSAARNDPNSADVQNLLGFSHRKQGNLDEAFKHYSRALELNPRHLGAHEYVGRAYLMAGKPEKAKEHMAALEQYCGETCPERDSLKKAIAEWDPWKSGVRTGRNY